MPRRGSRQPHVHAPGFRDDQEIRPRSPAESYRASDRKQPGREDDCSSARHTASITSRKPPPKSKCCPCRRRWATCSSAGGSIRTIGAKRTAKSRRATDDVVQRVLTDVEANKGNLILLHDGGGNRTQHRRGAAADHRWIARQGLPIRFRFGPAGADARADDASAFAQGMADGARRRVHFRRVSTGSGRESRPYSSPESCWSAAAL